MIDDVLFIMILTSLFINSFIHLLTDSLNASISWSYDVLYDGPNYINISYYMNHSTTPNINIIPNINENEYCTFITNTLIRKGKELTINYNDYNS
jgi:SET domain-containing protein